MLMEKEAEGAQSEESSSNVDSSTLLAAWPSDKKAPRYKKPILFGVVSAFAVILAFTIGFFTIAHGSLSHIYLGSIPIRADVTDSQLEQSVQHASDNYEITITYPDDTQKKFKLSDSGISVDIPKTIAETKSRLKSSLTSRLTWWKPINLSLATSTNQVNLDGFITTHATQATTPAQNAALSITDGTTVITPEVEGSGYNVADAQKLITDSASNLRSTELVLQPAKLKPAISSQDLSDEEAKVKAILAQNVTFNIDKRQITAKPSDITTWMELTPIENEKTVDITINSGKIVEYLDKIARPYVRPPRSKLISKSTGSVVILDQGRSGTDIINKDKTAADVAQQVLGAKGVNSNLEVEYSAAKTVEVESYDKYLIVDVTTKRMYAYEKTNLIRTFLISAGAPATPTVLGQYKILYKVAKQDMRGSNADGSRYLQPNVQYVNYFYKDYAIHGNYWRPTSYFGSVNSSHGCVGIVNSDAAWIYDWAPVGTPVITHD